MQILNRPMPHCDTFEKLIKDIKFQKTEEKLDPWTETLIKLYLPRINWELGDIRLKEDNKEPSLILRIIGVDGIQYLNSYPSTQQFMWVSDIDHHESIHPDIAMLLLFKHEGRDGKVIIDDKGRSILEVDGVTMIDTRVRKPTE
jgi:hypothetical protein